MGKIATANTIIPIPPSHCISIRKNIKERGNVSKLLKTLDPVVVNPEIASYMASVKLAFKVSENINGKAEAALNTVQNKVTTKNPSRVRNVALARRTGSHNNVPQLKVMLNPQ